MGIQKGGFMGHRDLLLEERTAYYKTQNQKYTSNSKKQYNKEKFKVNSYEAARNQIELRNPYIFTFQLLISVLAIIVMVFIFKITVYEFMTTPFQGGLESIEINKRNHINSSLKEAKYLLDTNQLEKAHTILHPLITELPYHQDINFVFTDVLIQQCHCYNMYCNDATNYIHHLYYYNLVSEERMIEMLGEL